MIIETIFTILSSFSKKIANWIPNREEHRRNQIEEIKREIDKIQASVSTPSSRKHYRKLTNKLRKLRQAARNN